MAGIEVYIPLGQGTCHGVPGKTPLIFIQVLPLPKIIASMLFVMESTPFIQRKCEKLSSSNDGSLRCLAKSIANNFCCFAFPSHFHIDNTIQYLFFFLLKLYFLPKST